MEVVIKVVVGEVVECCKQIFLPFLSVIVWAR